MDVYWPGGIFAITDSIDRLETYDFRAQEEFYNNHLPQYRVNVNLGSHQGNPASQESLRIHFVHRRSSHERALPLLICHDWGGSFIEAAKVIQSLCEPITTPPLGDPDAQAFHVVCPSIPGFGFSDMSLDGQFGIDGTADTFHLLMTRLGYSHYMVHGTCW